MGKVKVVDATNRIKCSESVREVKEYKGKKNETLFPDLINLLKKTQVELKEYLKSKMELYYKKENIICEDGFLYIRGTDPVCLTSHMDTTLNVEYGKRIPVRDWYEDEFLNIKTGKWNHKIISPQGVGGDDRCGVWTILNILKETNFRPYIVFCEDEEIGCIGSKKFAKTKWCEDLKNCKFLVEIDRRGNNDAVFYDDDNEEFHRWVEKVTEYKEAWGSCSDISYLCPACGVAAVNLSSGYYGEHSMDEYIIPEETLRTKDAVIKLIKEAVKEETEQFEYIERSYYRRKYGYGSIYNYDTYDDFSRWYKKNYGYESIYDDGDVDENIADSKMCGYFTYADENMDELEDWAEGNTKLECIGNFFLEHPEVCWADVYDYAFEEYTDEVEDDTEEEIVTGEYFNHYTEV